MNYTDLKAEVARYLHRTDLTSQIPTFIGMAEAALFRELNIRDLQTTATLTMAGEFAPLPVDFGTLVKLDGVVGGTTYALDYQSKPERNADPSASPTVYAFESGQIRVYGAGASTTYTLYYTPKVEALSATNADNWLSVNAPDLYLFASCLEGAKYIRAGDLAQALTVMVAEKLEAVRRFIERKTLPSNSGLQIKVRRG